MLISSLGYGWPGRRRNVGCCAAAGHAALIGPAHVEPSQEQGLRRPVPDVDLPGAARPYSAWLGIVMIEVAHQRRPDHSGHTQSTTVRDNGCMCAMILVSASGARLHPIVLTLGAAWLESGAPSSRWARSDYGALAGEQAGTQDRHASGSHVAARIPGDDLGKDTEGLMVWGYGYHLLNLPTSDYR